ncbi:hypothetical protein Tco_0394453 [Tanacetum coccineum]
MHNNIMAAGSKDRPPMLGPGRYSQWRSRFLRYIDTKPNGEGLRKSILSGPVANYCDLIQSCCYNRKAIFLLLTGISDVSIPQLTNDVNSFTSRDGESMGRYYLVYTDEELKGRQLAKLLFASTEEVSDPEQAQRD